MHDTHYVDPQVKPILAAMDQAYGDYMQMSLPEVRARFAEAAVAMARPLPPDCAEAYFDVPGPGGPVPCRSFRPSETTGPLPVILHFLGGTFVATSLAQVGWTPIALALETQCIVVTPLHRMPPEHPFPAAYDDALAVYRWLLAHAGDLGGDTARIAVHGQSSGATLAASVCIDARELGIPQPVLQVLAEPFLDHQSETPSMNEFSYVLSKDAVRMGSRYYFGDDPPPRRASPLRALSLAGVAPAYVTSAGLDPLRDEAIAYVARLRAEGVPVAHRHHDGQVHGFSSMFEQVLQSKIAFRECCSVLQLAFEGGLAAPSASGG